MPKKTVTLSVDERIIHWLRSEAKKEDLNLSDWLKRFIKCEYTRRRLASKSDGDIPTAAMMRLAESGRALDFWNNPEEDVYSAENGEPRA